MKFNPLQSLRPKIFWFLAYYRLNIRVGCFKKEESKKFLDSVFFRTISPPCLGLCFFRPLKILKQEVQPCALVSGQKYFGSRIIIG